MSQIPDDIFKPETQNSNALKSVLIMTDDKTEDLEFFYPYYRFIEEGFHVDVATLDGGEFKGKHGTGIKETKKIADIDVASYDLLYVPGGKAPAKLRKNDEAVTLVRHFFETGKPIAALCHGPQVLAEAGIIQGKRIAAWPEIANEITEAGGSFINSETVVDGQIITGRWPGDLPAHLARTLEVLRSAEEQDPRPFHATGDGAAIGTVLQ